MSEYYQVWPEAEPFSFPRGEPAVLLIHGFTGTTYGVRKWGEYLASRGFAVDAPRLPGHGTSLVELAGCSYKDWRVCVEERFSSLQRTHERVFVAGHSMGGTLALSLGARQPDGLAGIITVNAPLFLANPLLPIVPVAKYFLRSFPGVGGDLKDTSQIDICYDKVSVRAVHELMKLMRDTKRRLPEVRAPLFVIQSRQDHVVPAANAEYIIRHAGSAGREVIYLDNSYHMAPLDFDRDEVFRRCQEFILEHEVGR